MTTEEEAVRTYGRFDPIEAKRLVNEVAFNGDFELAISRYKFIPLFHAWIVYSLEEGREILNVYEEPWF